MSKETFRGGMAIPHDGPARPHVEPGRPTVQCDICLNGNSVELDHNYGDGACRQCGTRYEYDECQRIVLSDDQRALLRSPPRWIPVTERLPDGVETVAVWGMPLDADGIPACSGVIATGWYERLGDGDGEHWVIDGDMRPTHWMPLPPYPRA